VYEALLAGERNIVVEAPAGLGRSPDDGCEGKAGAVPHNVEPCREAARCRRLMGGAP